MSLNLLAYGVQKMSVKISPGKTHSTPFVLWPCTMLMSRFVQLVVGYYMYSPEGTVQLLSNGSITNSHPLFSMFSTTTREVASHPNLVVLLTYVDMKKTSG